MPSPRPIRRFDWPAWLALGWATWFGVLYVGMVLRERSPALAHAIGQWVTP